MGKNHSKKREVLPQIHPIEHHDYFIPIEGYEEMPLVSLEIAVEPLMSLLPSIQTYVRLAKQKCENPADGLTPDESASIMLCTMRWQPLDQCLSVALTTALCSNDRQKLKRWFLYLKLLMTALNRLPSVHRTVFRGIKADVTQFYPKNKTIAWYDFALCTDSIDTLKSEEHLGFKGPRTILSINCDSCKDISKHLFYPTKGIMLLPAGTEFQVIQNFKQALNVNLIELKEVQSPFTQLSSISSLVEYSQEFVYTDSTSFTNLPIRRVKYPLENENEHNQELANLIAKYPSKSIIQLKLENVSASDMSIIVNQAIFTKRCTELWLYNAQIQSHSTLILSNGLYNNKTLTKLNLSDNNICDQGVFYLARVLIKNNSKLKELNLARNGITSAGAQHLAEMLNTNKTLTKLILYGNKIDDRGIKYLTHSLSYYNTTLEYLYLSGNNRMTDSCVDNLINMLLENQSLKYLYLFNCNLSEIGKANLLEASRRKINFKLYI